MEISCRLHKRNIFLIKLDKICSILNNHEDILVDFLRKFKFEKEKLIKASVIVNDVQIQNDSFDSTEQFHIQSEESHPRVSTPDSVQNDFKAASGFFLLYLYYNYCINIF